MAIKVGHLIKGGVKFSEMIAMGWKGLQIFRSYPVRMSSISSNACKKIRAMHGSLLSAGFVFLIKLNGVSGNIMPNNLPVHLEKFLIE